MEWKVSSTSSVPCCGIREDWWVGGCDRDRDRDRDRGEAGRRVELRMSCCCWCQRDVEIVPCFIIWLEFNQHASPLVWFYFAKTEYKTEFSFCCWGKAFEKRTRSSRPTLRSRRIINSNRNRKSANVYAWSSTPVLLTSRYSTFPLKQSGPWATSSRTHPSNYLYMGGRHSKPAASPPQVRKPLKYLLVRGSSDTCHLPVLLCDCCRSNNGRMNQR